MFSSQEKRKRVLTEINQAYCDDHFTTYTYIELLCCTPKTNIVFYIYIYISQLYLNINTLKSINHRGMGL